MADTFWDLIEACGVPRLLVLNRARDAFDEPYLLIRSFASVPRRRYREVRADLERRDVVVHREGTRRGPLGGLIPTVEVAVRADVEGLGQEGLEVALDERRVLLVYGQRSMGDGNVSLYVGGEEADADAVRHAPYTFVFDPPCRLTGATLPSAEAWQYGTAREYLQFFWERRMVRAWPLPPKPRRAPRPDPP